MFNKPAVGFYNDEFVKLVAGRLLGYGFQTGLSTADRKPESPELDERGLPLLEHLGPML